MGRIKTVQIKRLTNEIFEKFKDKVATDYNKNKEFLARVSKIRSKKIRNIIAGYLTRLAKTQEI